MILQQTKVYVPTEMNELPDKDGTYCVLSKCNVNYPLQTYDSLRFQQGVFQEIPNWKHIHWLKEQILYALTKEELERVIRFVYNSAIDYENQSMGSFLNDDVPNLNTLINQILK